ncbi:hypothetical protein [Pseudomonas sivasensis]|uniref:Uncharacterized protein n=1 Tax=Pseudomonas sivasensis TaxID=1880678 RepID=A0ABW8DTH3_9PSED
MNMINGYHRSSTAEVVKKRRKRISKDFGGKRSAYPDKAQALRYYKFARRVSWGMPNSRRSSPALA